MTKALLYDLSGVDTTRDLLPADRIGELLPQRHEFALVERVCHLDFETPAIVAVKRFRESDWWAKGHFPNRPLVPGVLLVEAAAQVATLLWKVLLDGRIDGDTIGFGGLEQVRFRAPVEPPAEVLFVSRAGHVRPRYGRFPAQAVLDGKVVFEGVILGVRI